MLIPAKHFLQRAWWAALAYSIALKYVVVEFLGKRVRSRDQGGKVYQKQNGKEAVVTGGSRGIGLEIVNNLLECGYNVIIGSSSSKETRNNLEQSLQKKYPGCSVEVWHLDLASLKSVKIFSELYLSRKESLHLLINNAGIMFIPQEITEDGYEKHFAVNYLGHCLLTQLLLPILEKTGSKNDNTRIINCSSCIHYVGNTDIKNFQHWQYYSKYKAYIQSKLAQVMFTYSLQDYFNKNNMNVRVNSVHPGVVNTELMNSVFLIPSFGPLLFKSAKEGAETATYAALSPEMEGVGGKYLEECAIVNSSKISQIDSIQTELWKYTWSALRAWMSDNDHFFSVPT